MKKRKKECKYCGEVFYPKRIDAQYCSTSCRSMGYRAEKKKNLYDEYHLIQFNLKILEYRTFFEHGMKFGLKPNQYAVKGGRDKAMDNSFC